MVATSSSLRPAVQEKSEENPVQNPGHQKDPLARRMAAVSPGRVASPVLHLPPGLPAKPRQREPGARRTSAPLCNSSCSEVSASTHNPGTEPGFACPYHAALQRAGRVRPETMETD